MLANHESPMPYLPLNNLDLLYEGGTPNPYTSEENLFDESPDDLTLDDKYADANEEQLQQLMDEAFLEGADKFRRIPYKTPETLRREGKLDGRTFAENVLRFIAWHVRTNHRLHTHRLSLLDRIQNGNLYLSEAVKKYDPALGPSLIAAIRPFLTARIDRPESGGVGVNSALPIFQGDMIRIPRLKKSAYYRVKRFHEGVNVRFGRHLHDTELEQLSNFTTAELEEYRKHHVEYVSFHRILDEEGELTESSVDGFIDNDPQVNPYEAVVPTGIVHDGVAAALNLVSEGQKAAIVARLRLHSQDQDTLLYRDVAAEIGLNSHQNAHMLCKRGLDTLRGIPNVQEIIRGKSRLPDEAETSEHSGDKWVQLTNESLFVKHVRLMLGGHYGLIGKLARQGISRTVLEEEAGLHPYYAEGKIKGQVFMTDKEAARLVRAVESLVERSFPHSSLYDLVPQSGVINEIFAELEKNQLANY
jgi:DNA-directed RNA polymerase sigma subunit (sigma70/sigma32)